MPRYRGISTPENWDFTGVPYKYWLICKRCFRKYGSDRLMDNGLCQDCQLDKNIKQMIKRSRK